MWIEHGSGLDMQRHCRIGAVDLWLSLLLYLAFDRREASFKSSESHFYALPFGVLAFHHVLSIAKTRLAIVHTISSKF